MTFDDGLKCHYKVAKIFCIPKYKKIFYTRFRLQEKNI